MRDRPISQEFEFSESSLAGMRTDIVQDHSRVVEVDHEAGKRKVGRQKTKSKLGSTTLGDSVALDRLPHKFKYFELQSI